MIVRLQAEKRGASVGWSDIQSVPVVVHGPPRVCHPCGLDWRRAIGEMDKGWVCGGGVDLVPLSQLPRVISLRVLLPPILGFASLYAYKRATHNPETDVKDQVQDNIKATVLYLASGRQSLGLAEISVLCVQLVKHVQSRLSEVTQPTCHGYGQQVQSTLRVLLDMLRAELARKTEDVNTSIATCNQELRTLSTYHTRAKNLK